MPRCTADPVRWKSRRAYCLSNGVVELTVLPGGGHLADFRLSGSPLNVLWEAPWPTIEPQDYTPSAHGELYGDGPVGRLLCSYTGHALALGYFGMPSLTEAANGMPLHGEAANAEWKVVTASSSDDVTSIELEITLPAYQLHFHRALKLRAGSSAITIKEVVTNLADAPVEFQWVEHVAFGEPFFSKDEATLFLSGSRGTTWPLGYECRELLPNNLEFHWPMVQKNNDERVDLSAPFTREGTGFVAAVLTDLRRPDAYIAVHNREEALVAGYSFNRRKFPWIALWEENCARTSAPWNGVTRVRGVEFGTSPMPLGLEHARSTRTLFDTPVLRSLNARASVVTKYDLFVSATPPEWTGLRNVTRSGTSLTITGDAGEQLTL